MLRGGCHAQCPPIAQNLTLVKRENKCASVHGGGKAVRKRHSRAPGRGRQQMFKRYPTGECPHYLPFPFSLRADEMQLRFIPRLVRLPCYAMICA